MNNSLLQAFAKYQQKPKARKILEADDEPQDESSILSMVGRSALSGLNAFGNTLDVPASMVRDVASNENPFDQLLTPFSDENRVTEREMFRRKGMVGQEDTYANWWGSFLGAQPLDPLNYLSFGAAGAAKTAAGKAAQAAGVLGDVAKVTGKGKRMAMLTTSLGDYWKKLGKAADREALTETVKKLGGEVDQLGMPIGKLGEDTLGTAARFGLPWPLTMAVGDPGINFGRGALSQGMAHVGDAVGDFASKTYPGRFFNMLFEPEAMGRFDPHEQDLARGVSGLLPAGQAEGRRVIYETGKTYGDLFKQFEAEYRGTIAGAMPANSSPDQISSAVQKAYDDTFRLSMERPQGGVADAVGEILKHGHGLTNYNVPSQGLEDAMNLLGKTTQDLKRQPFQSFLDMGGNSGLIDSGIAGDGSDQFQHFYRFVDYAKDPNKGKLAGVYQAGRDDAVRHIPAFVADKIAEGQKYKGQNAAQAIAADFGSYLNPNYGGGIQKHAADLAEWGVSKDAAGFTRGTMPDLAKGLMGIQKARKSLEAVHEFFLDNAVDMGQNAPAGTIPLGQAFKQIGLDDIKAENYYTALAAVRGKGTNVAIPKEIVNAARATLDIVNKPTYQNEFFRLLDNMTGWFKQNVTLPFPRHHVRNLGSGQFMNVASGLIDGADDMRKYGSAVADAVSILHGKKNNPAIVTSREAKIRDIVAEGVYTPNGFDDVDPISSQPRMTPQMPFGGGTWQAAGKAVGEANEFLGEVTQGMGVKGRVGGALNRIGSAMNLPRQAYTALLETGSRTGQQIEWMNRVGMYLYLTEHKGWSKSAAAAKVAELQADYTKKTPFERDVMSRLVPFYTWQRRIAPVVLKDILERPGGMNAMTVKAANRASGGDATTPDYVRSTASMPLGKDEQGNAHYVTGFGLPWEQPLEYFSNFPSPQAAGREVVSQMNPLVKAPLEWITGQSFFQRGTAGAGRRLEDMDPILGRIASNISGRPEPLSLGAATEFAFANSPASVVGSQIRQATDPRKSALYRISNALTGVRVSTVSPAAQDAVLRERANDLMRSRGANLWEKMYFPKDELAEMPPEQKQIATRLGALQTALAQRAKERKAERDSSRTSPPR